jgi:hypothetical protein
MKKISYNKRKKLIINMKLVISPLDHPFFSFPLVGVGFLIPPMKWKNDLDANLLECNK